MKYLRYLSIFVVSFLIVTLLSPLSYALPKVTIIDETGSACDDVWVTTLDWYTYQQLLGVSQTTLDQIDAIGNKESWEYQNQLEMAEISDDPSVNDAKNEFIMGPTGEQVMIYDIQQRRAISPVEQCHMSNLIVDGKFSYSTLVTDLRLCTGEECEYGVPTQLESDELDEKGEMIADLKDALDTNDTTKMRRLVNNDSEVERAFTNVAPSFEPSTDEIEELSSIEKQNIVKSYGEIIWKDVSETFDKISGFNIMISDYMFVGISRGANLRSYIFPQNFMKYVEALQRFKSADQAYMTWVMVEGAIGGVQMFRSVKTGVQAAGGVANYVKAGAKGVKTAGKSLFTKVRSLFGREKGIFRALRGEIAGISKVDKLTDAQLKVSKLKKLDVNVEILSKEGKVIGKTSLDDAIRTISSGKTTDLKPEQITRAISSQQDILSDNLRSIERYQEVVGKGKTFNELENDLDAARIAYQVDPSALNKIKMDKAGRTVLQYDELSDAAYNLREANVYLDNAKALDQNSLASINEARNYIGAADTRVGNSLTEMSRLDRWGTDLRATTYVDRSVINSMKKYGGKFDRWDDLTARTVELLARIGGMGRGLVGKMIRAGGYMVVFSAFATWIYNGHLQDPYFEADLMTFEISADTADVIHNEGKEYYLELTTSPQNLPKTDEGWEIGSYVFSKFAQLISIGFGGDDSNELPEEILFKLRNLGDFVFIFDGVNSVVALNPELNTNVVTPLGGHWSFFSNYKNPADFIAYEHPNAHLECTGECASEFGDVKHTEMWMHSKNIDISAAYRERTDAFGNSFRSAIGGIGDAGRLLLYGGVIMGAPVYGSIILVPAAAGIGPVAALFVSYGIYYNFVGPGFEEEFEDLWAGDVANPEKAYGLDIEETCEDARDKYVGDGDIWLGGGDVGGAKRLVYVTGYGSSVAHAVGNVFPPAHLVGFVLDGANIWATSHEQEVEEEAFNHMTNCAETDFTIGTHQIIQSPEDISEDFLAALADSDLIRGIESALSGIMPGAGDVIKKIGEFDSQLLHTSGYSDPGTINVLGKEVYDMHFQEADLKWFQDDSCEIDFCSQVGSETYKCVTQKGYFLVDEEGNTLFEEPLPQALSLHLNTLDMYSGMVQKVIEVEKDDSDTNELMRIYPTTVEANNGCLESVLNNITFSGVEKLGFLDVIQTDTATIWPMGNEILVRFTTSGSNNRALETVHVENGYIKFYRDSKGKIVIADENDEELYELELGSGVMSFTNGMIRSGFEQDGDDTYADLYHIFIYDLMEVSTLDIDNFGLDGLCTDQDGDGLYDGIKMDGTLITEQSAEFATLLSEICFTDFDGINGEHISIRDGFLCVLDADGNEVCYEIDDDPTTDLLELINANGQQEPMIVYVGDDGLPYMQIGQQAPIPLLWAQGLGGSWRYDQDTGRFTISNEYMFPINPNFGIYGGGGNAFFSPGYPPWGGTPVGGGDGGIGTQPQPNILAQLPWLPEGFELMLFIVTLFGSLLLIRVKYSKKKKRDTP